MAKTNRAEIGDCSCIANKLRWYAARSLTDEINSRDKMLQEIREVPHEERLKMYGTKWEEVVHLIEMGTKELERYRNVVNSATRCDEMEGVLPESEKATL